MSADEEMGTYEGDSGPVEVSNGASNSARGTRVVANGLKKARSMFISFHENSKAVVVVRGRSGSQVVLNYTVT